MFLSSLPDLYIIYHSQHLDPDRSPKTLANKVQFDFRLYFARRGSENMHAMLKSDLEIKRDPTTHLKYALKVTDEETKNHKGQEDGITTGYMVEVPGDKKNLCHKQNLKLSVQHRIYLSEQQTQN